MQCTLFLWYAQYIYVDRYISRCILFTSSVVRHSYSPFDAYNVECSYPEAAGSPVAARAPLELRGTRILPRANVAQSPDYLPARNPRTTPGRNFARQAENCFEVELGLVWYPFPCSTHKPCYPGHKAALAAETPYLDPLVRAGLQQVVLFFFFLCPSLVRLSVRLSTWLLKVSGCEPAYI